VVVYALKLSRWQYAMKSSYAIILVNVELVSKVSETVLVPKFMVNMVTEGATDCLLWICTAASIRASAHD
jgi:hypothetical protein